MNRAALLRAASPSSRRAANAWKTCGTPGVMSRMTATSSAAAFTARRVASSRSTSCDPAWISSGGRPGGRRWHRQALRLAGDEELDGEVAAGRLARHDDVAGPAGLPGQGAVGGRDVLERGGGGGVG